MERSHFRQGMVGLNLMGILLIFTLTIGCAKSGEGENQASSTNLSGGQQPPPGGPPVDTGTGSTQNVPTPTDGFYLGPCKAVTGVNPGSIQYGYVFQGQNVTLVSRYSRGPQCGDDGTPYLVSQSAGTFELRAGTAGADAEIDLHIPFYLRNDYQPDPADPLSENGVSYDRIRITGNTFQLGKKTAERDGTTRTKRPNELESTITYTLRP